MCTLRFVLFRYAPYYGIIIHTSYLSTFQRPRLKEVIQMHINSEINPRRRRDNQFFLSCFTTSASSFSVGFHMTSLKFKLQNYRSYFRDVLEQLKTNFYTNFRSKRVLGFVI